jgi:hypothetical protein
LVFHQGVDLVQGPLIAVGQAAGVGFLSAVGEPAAQVQALVVFDPPGGEVSVAGDVVAGDEEFALDAVRGVLPDHAEGVQCCDAFG